MKIIGKNIAVSCTLCQEPLFCTAKYFTATNMNFRESMFNWTT
jgi:hypothetical protein